MERWDEVLLNQGEFLVMVSTARHHGLPPPAGQDMQGALFTQWTPDKNHANVLPNTTHLGPPLTRYSRNFWEPLSSKRSPRMGNSFWWGVGGPFGAGRAGPSG